MNPIRAQQQIRNNASELSDYLSDLKSWGSDMKKKETKSKSKSTNHDDLPPIRNPKATALKIKQNEETAMKFKSQGNAHFKAAKYDSAIQCYTRAIEASPDTAVLYSNRAMALLKTNDFASAESDCTRCLELDSSQIKALFRRGLARKGLKKYHLALRDFESALKLKPEDKAALKQKREMKQKMDAMLKRSKERQFGSSKPKVASKDKMRRIVIEECTTDSEDSGDGDEAKMQSSTLIREEDVKEEVATVPRKKKPAVREKPQEEVKVSMVEATPFSLDANDLPTHFIGFEKLWNRAATIENRATVLLAMKKKKMERIIKNMMDDVMFSQMIQTVHFIGMHRDVADALRILKQLTKLERFEMIVMFMEQSDQELLKELKEKCADSQLGTAVFAQFE